MKEILKENVAFERRNKVYIETHGCQMNVSDSERVATKLAAAGYEISASSENADVVLLNTCSVREKAEQKLYTRVGELTDPKRVKKNPVVGVLGCVAQLEGETLFDKTEKIDFVVGTRAVGRIDTVIEQLFREKFKITDVGEREEAYDWNVAVNRNHSPYVAFLPIIEGCNKFCTYCIVPFSRGREKSLSAEEIVARIYKLKAEGFKEVHLIGQNVNSYRPRSDSGLERFPGATPFSRLLRAVAATGMERVKFNTSFPRDFHPDIVTAINEFENLCNWVHLPVQSGSDRILRLMRRGHTAADYLKRVFAIKSSPRQIAFTTDIIVGFPGETDEDFAATMRLYEECRFDSAYIFKYSRRSGTPAASLADDVSAESKRERFLTLESVQKRIQTEIFEDYRGRVLDVLAEDISAKSQEDLTGHSTCHKVVNFPASVNLLGKIVRVLIVEQKANSLRGIIVS